MRSPDADTPVLRGGGGLSALGGTLESTWDALLADRTGIQPVDGGGAAAVVPQPWLAVDVPDALQGQVKFLNGSGQLAVTCADEAWEAAGWGDDPSVPPERRGLWLGQIDAWDWRCTEMRPAFEEATAAFTEAVDVETLNRSASRRVKPFFLLESIKNNAFAFVSALLDLRGANTGASGFGGGMLSLVDVACRALRRHDVDRALVVGTGRVADAVAHRDAELLGLAASDSDGFYRPFDVSGGGVLLGEAAAALAFARLADVPQGPAVALLGMAAGVGEPLGEHPHPSASVLASVVRGACADAGLVEGDLLGVVAPSLGLPATDAALLAALDTEGVTRGAPVVSWRGATGYAAYGSEALEVALAARALVTRTLPGTVGLDHPLPEAVSRVAATTTAGDAPAVLVLAAGLHGGASAAVLGRVD